MQQQLEQQLENQKIWIWNKKQDVIVLGMLFAALKSAFVFFEVLNVLQNVILIILQQSVKICDQISL